MPVATTTAVAEPLSTLVPRNAIAGQLDRRPSPAAAFSASCFSTGKLSPVSEPWITNRSLACDDPHVAGDHVAGGELDHVAGNELRERDLLRLAVAQRRSR